MTKNISFTLTNEHVKTVCKPGQDAATCRYLTVSGNGFVCGKFSSLMYTINERVANNEMKAKGDNCDALLGEIMNAKDALIGNKIHYKERLPSYEVDGTVNDMIYDKKKGWFTIKIEAGEGSFPYSARVESLSIDNAPGYFRFELSGQGAFGGTVKLYK